MPGNAVKIACFLIEPILGAPLPDPAGARDWPPHRYIIGWRRPDTGEERKHNSEFGVGAMWRATWQPKNWDWQNETEPHLLVRCPNGPLVNGRYESTRDWDIDSRASNCTLPNEKLHRCWIRHGEPPNITVDKGGLTCAAGAGSIALTKWHGYLTGGFLSEQR